MWLAWQIKESLQRYDELCFLSERDHSEYILQVSPGFEDMNIWQDWNIWQVPYSVLEIQLVLSEPHLKPRLDFVISRPFLADLRFILQKW